MQRDESAASATPLNSESRDPQVTILGNAREGAGVIAQAPGVLVGSDQGRSHGYIALSLRRLLRKKLAVFFLTVIVVMYGSAVLAPVVTPYGYNNQDLSIAKQGPTLAHPFGTDRLGRDMLTRVIYGLRTTVLITIIALMGGSLLIGITMGLLGGYFGGKIDALINRVGEVTSAFPDIFLIIIIAATVRPRVKEIVRGFEEATGIDWIIEIGIVDYATITLALTVFAWFGMSRLVRGQVLQIRENQYVEASRAMGASTARILRLRVLPNVISVIIVSISASLAA
ncbi:MAG: ABC transporter permease, partial [Dehalococcoidia bacterium]